MEQLERLTDDDADNFSIYADDADEDGKVLSQHRFYRWGDCIIAIGELNYPNQWDDEAFDAKCAALEAALAQGPVA